MRGVLPCLAAKFAGCPLAHAAPTKDRVVLGLAMDSAVLGIASSGVATGMLGVGQDVGLEDAIEFHDFAPPLEVLSCVWPLACLSDGHFSHRFSF